MNIFIMIPIINATFPPNTPPEIIPPQDPPPEIIPPVKEPPIENPPEVDPPKETGCGQLFFYTQVKDFIVSASY
jgi:hypothetical protein